MRKAVTQTSLLSYMELRKEQKLGKLQQAVYDYLLLHPRSSDRQITDGLGMTINCLCGRRNELMDMGLVKNSGLEYDEVTRRMVMVWSANI